MDTGGQSRQDRGRLIPPPIFPPAGTSDDPTTNLCSERKDSKGWVPEPALGLSMRNLTDHLSQYAAYHRDKRNILTHLVGIPMIVLAIVVLLARWQWPLAGLLVSPASVLVLVSVLFYLRLDLPLGVLMGLLLAVVHQAGHAMAAWSLMPWLGMGVGLFVVGWVFQFVGHYFEGKKPAFVDDIAGLIIGPLFVVAELVFALGMRKDLRLQIESRVGPIKNAGAGHTRQHG